MEREWVRETRTWPWPQTRHRCSPSCLGVPSENPTPPDPSAPCLLPSPTPTLARGHRLANSPNSCIRRWEEGERGPPGHRGRGVDAAPGTAAPARIGTGVADCDTAMQAGGGPAAPHALPLTLPVPLLPKAPLRVFRTHYSLRLPPARGHRRSHILPTRKPAAVRTQSQTTTFLMSSAAWPLIYSSSLSSQGNILVFFFSFFLLLLFYSFFKKRKTAELLCL